MTLGLAAFAVAALMTTGRADAAPVHLMILGDSLTAGYGLPTQDGFQAKLAEALKAKNVDVTLVDAAVSGDTTTDAAARLDWALGGGPIDAAIVVLGGNDALRALDPSLMKHNLSYILDKLQSRHIPVLLSGMIAPSNLGVDYDDRYTAVFTDLGKRPGLIYDPFFLAGLPGHPEYAQADGLHPNAAGVAIEVNRLLPIVLRLVAQAEKAQPKQTKPD
ncbi:arylesterase [Acidisoma cellulosilyticum]|nr:arylesterase [Acidisoma cellulosilyticum]